MDRETDMAKITVALHGFVNMPKNWTVLDSIRSIELTFWQHALWAV